MNCTQLTLSQGLRTARFGLLSIFLAFTYHTASAQTDSTAAPEAAAEASAAAEPAAGGDAALIAQGKTIFEGQCTQCHRLWEKNVGPALSGVTERRSHEWLYAWIRNSQKVIASGDEYANALYAEYNNTLMPSYDFTDEELASILAYLDDETAKGPPAAEAASPTGDGTAAAGGGMPSEYLDIIIVAFLVLLAIILVVLFLIISVLVRYLKDKGSMDEDDEEVVSGSFNLGAFLTSRPVLGILVFVFTAVAIKTVVGALFSVGMQQGYQPTQPIAFSHALHAGTNEIECEYCHTGVSIGQSANIPSANICMNCHSAILTESPEIQKIYTAVEENKPIEWVRIHNLPDLAYFNHQQHYVVGGIECQTCHGPIEEMEVVYQYSTLTMGWCINCHRETAVKTKGNDYYTKLVELHDGGELKVEDIGGLECSKCHY